MLIVHLFTTNLINGLPEHKLRSTNTTTRLQLDPTANAVPQLFCLSILLRVFSMLNTGHPSSRAGQLCYTLIGLTFTIQLLAYKNSCDLFGPQEKNWQKDMLA